MKYLSFNTAHFDGLFVIYTAAIGSLARASGENLINDHRCKARERSIGIRCQLAARVANRIIAMTIVRRREKEERSPYFVICDYNSIFLSSANNTLLAIIARSNYFFLHVLRRARNRIARLRRQMNEQERELLILKITFAN